MSAESDGELHARLTPKNEMERWTVRFPDGLVTAIQAKVDGGEYANRSEAIRDAVRETFAGGDD